MMFHVKTASVRDLRQDFPRILAWLQSGEEVAITLRREAVATLIPRPPPKRARRAMPDLGARLQKVFGERVIPDQTVKGILDQDRGAY
jgi:antitoxin (DNA-binding transcriptional repressor) of toxin-antitoxin stability system